METNQRVIEYSAQATFLSVDEEGLKQAKRAMSDVIAADCRNSWVLSASL